MTYEVWVDAGQGRVDLTIDLEPRDRGRQVALRTDPDGGMTMRLLRRLRDREEGFTLSELLVAMMVLSLALAMFFTTLASVQRSVVETDIRHAEQHTGTAGPPDASTTRSVRATSCTTRRPPAIQSFRFKIYTQTNATTRQPSPGFTCRLWRITSDGGQLRTRWWEPAQSDPN